MSSLYLQPSQMKNPSNPTGAVFYPTFSASEEHDGQKNSIFGRFFSRKHTSSEFSPASTLQDVSKENELISPTSTRCTSSSSTWSYGGLRGGTTRSRNSIFSCISWNEAPSTSSPGLTQPSDHASTSTRTLEDSFDEVSSNPSQEVQLDAQHTTVALESLQSPNPNRHGSKFLEHFDEDIPQFPTLLPSELYHPFSPYGSDDLTSPTRSESPHILDDLSFDSGDSTSESDDSNLSEVTRWCLDVLVQHL